MFSLNTEDIKISLKELSGLFRFIPLIFLAPLPFAIDTVLSKDLFKGRVRLEDVLPLLGGISVQDFTTMIIDLVIRFLVFLVPAVLSYIIYSILREIAPKQQRSSQAKTKHIMMSVSVGWLIIALISALPYVLSSTLSPVDAVFESVSGWSTTGMTLIKDLESAPRDILFYRSLTQWLGGLGIIFTALSVFMRKGTVAMDYYTPEKGEKRIKPSIRGTVTEIWKIYGVYTVICFILLYLAGMGLYDALNHSMSVLATGGFSTHNDNIGFFQDRPAILIISVLFMFVGSISFFVHFRLFEGKIGFLIQNLEFRYMLTLIALASIAISVVLYLHDPSLGVNAVIQAVIHAVSAMTTTGFSIVDLSKWPEAAQILLIPLMYIGGFYGSTAGGIKILRFILLIEIILYSIKKLTLPKTAIIRIKIGNSHVEGEEIFNVFGSAAAYLLIMFIGALLLMSEYTATQSFFLSASAIGNVGLINVSPDHWFAMSITSKVILSFLMWAGRLEILPVLVFLNSLYLKKRTPNFQA